MDKCKPAEKRLLYLHSANSFVPCMCILVAPLVHFFQVNQMMKTVLFQQLTLYVIMVIHVPNTLDVTVRFYLLAKEAKRESNYRCQ